MGEAREIRATFVGAAAVAAYLIAVVASPQVNAGQFAQLFLAYVSGSFALWVVLGVGFLLVSLFRQARRSGKEPFLAAWVRGAIAARWERDRGLSLVWPPLLFATLLASFNSFKQMILPVAGYGWDPLLAKADRLLFESARAMVRSAMCEHGYQRAAADAAFAFEHELEFRVAGRPVDMQRFPVRLRAGRGCWCLHVGFETAQGLLGFRQHGLVDAQACVQAGDGFVQQGVGPAQGTDFLDQRA